MRRPVYKSTFKPRSIRRSESKAKNRLIFNLVLIIVLVFVFFNWGLPFIVGNLSFLNKFKSSKPVEVVNIDEAIAPPVLNIPFEATNSASLAFSGYSAPNSKIQLYIDDELKSSTDTNSDGKFQTEPIDLNLGTNNIYAVTINDKEKKSLPSKTIKLTYSSDKPKLEISEPPDGIEIKGDKKVKLAGSTDSENTVTVNGSTVIVNYDGNFQTEISLNDGENIITIVSSNNFGNTNRIEKRVKYTPQEPSPSPSSIP